MRARTMIMMASIILLAACQSTSGGRTPTTYSAAKSVQLADADLNLPRYLQTYGLSIERRIRDNGSVVTEVYERNGRTIARTERVYSDWFSAKSEQNLNDSGHLAKLLKSGAARFGANDAMPAPRGGKSRVLGLYSKNGGCAAFFVGFRNRVGSVFDNDQGNVDTIVFFAGCSVLRTDVATVVAGLRAMTDADRIAIAQQASTTDGAGASVAARRPG